MLPPSNDEQVPTGRTLCRPAASIGADDNIGSWTMPRGNKGAYTDKQRRKAEHIEEGYEERAV